MAGLGGFFGYALGAINWDATTIGMLLMLLRVREAFCPRSRPHSGPH